MTSLVTNGYEFESIPTYPAPCPVTPYRRSKSSNLTKYRSIYRDRPGFGEEDEVDKTPQESSYFADPDTTTWHTDQRFGLVRADHTEWVKMINQEDLSPHALPNNTVTSHVQKPQPAQAPVPRLPMNDKPLPTKPVVSTLQPHPEGPSFVKEKGAKLPVAVPPKSEAPSAPYRPFEENNRTDEYYRRYLQLSGNIAFRHPNPGYPRERQGAIGGSWRHIKEVGGYHGGQVCFVDGLVRLYDTEAKSNTLMNSRNTRASMATPAYAPNRHNVASYQQQIKRGEEQRAYKPWEESRAPGLSDTPRQQMAPGLSDTPRQQMATSSSKYKGFYNYRQ